MNMFRFWTVGGTKQANWRHHTELHVYAFSSKSSNHSLKHPILYGSIHSLVFPAIFLPISDQRNSTYCTKLLYCTTSTLY